MFRRVCLSLNRRAAVGALWAAAVLAGCQSAPPAASAEVPAVGGFTAQQLALLRQEGFHPTDEGWELGFSDKILFALDADELTDQARRAVARLGGVLRGVDIERLRVEGHTDSSGGRDYNEKLSLRRAAAVARALEGVGFREADVAVSGLGSSRPVADNATPAGRAENRRVAIVVPTP